MGVRRFYESTSWERNKGCANPGAPAQELALANLMISPGVPGLPNKVRKFGVGLCGVGMRKFGVGFRPVNGAKQLFFQKSSANLTTKLSDPIK